MFDRYTVSSGLTQRSLDPVWEHNTELGQQRVVVHSDRH